MARRKTEPGGALTGAVAGLACITPCAGYVSTWSAFIIGFLAAVFGYGAVLFRERMAWDDALDVWACHGVGGMLGTVLVGVFCEKAINPHGANGLITGSAVQLGKQVVATALIAVYAFTATWLILKLLDKFEHVRVPDSVEQKGLDSELHGEEAYSFD